MPETPDRIEPVAPDRNLAVELVRVTEAAALAAARWIGRGEKNAADQAAVDAMRLMLRTVEMDGVVVIGEGEKDEAPMLYNGEHVGAGRGPQVDVAVDPLEGTVLTALGQPNALSVIAVSERGTMLYPETFYMEKLAVGALAVDAIDITCTPTENVERVAEALEKSARDVVVVVLDRDRNAALIEELRGLGARLHLIPHGDTAPAIAAARRGSGVDMVMGIGGGTEGVIAAAALKCLGGAMQARLWPRDELERTHLVELGIDPATVLFTDDLVAGQDVFVAATGVTSGSLLDGVLYNGEGAVTESVVMRSRSGTVRKISAEHRFEKLERFTGLEYRWGPSAHA
jgi:fructose-1,6-bisphosphatase II